jgi:hypothetical protein
MLDRIYSNKIVSYQKRNITKSKKYNPSFGSNVSLEKNFLNKLLVDGFAPYSRAKHFIIKMSHLSDYFKNKNKIADLYSKSMSIDENSSYFMGFFAELCKKIAKGQEVEINIEKGQLANIAKSDEACIFVMNHDNFQKDPKLLAIFNNLLAKEYLSTGKGETCPRTKVLLTKSMQKEKDAKSRAIFEKFGCVGIDASIFAEESNTNLKEVSKLIKAFSKNSVNIFIFPEGRMSKFKELDIEHKFQTGVGKMIQLASTGKQRVKVVPLGFAYDGELGGINIGEPVYFKKDGKKILTSQGNIKGQKNDPYQNFFEQGKADEDGFYVITKNGTPVTDASRADYISGLLCQNLKICKEKALKSLSDKNNIG